METNCERQCEEEEERREGRGHSRIRPQSDAVAFGSPAFLLMEKGKVAPPLPLRAHPPPALHTHTHPPPCPWMQERFEEDGRVLQRGDAGLQGGAVLSLRMCACFCFCVCACERVELSQQLRGEGKLTGLVTWALSLTPPHNEMLETGQGTQRAGRPSHPRNPICQGQRKESAESKVQSGH